MFDAPSLILEAQSPLDNVRKSSEERLLQMCDEDSSQVFVQFVQVAADTQQELPSRQFALLTLRKLVTMYWTPGFESFRGTSTVKLEARGMIRDVLLQLCLDEHQPSKIRNGASYAVVQISAVDFPDQWPELLNIVYNAIMKSHSLAAMKLLNEIYDDVISEEMFFEEGIGFETLKIVFHVMNSYDANWEAKVAALNLLHCCILQMSTVNGSSTTKRKELTVEACKEILQMWVNFLTTQNKTISETLQLMAGAKIYQGLTLLKNEFSKKIVAPDMYHQFRTIVMRDLENASQIYMQMVENSSQDQLDAINEYAVNILEFLSSLCDVRFTEEELQTVLRCLSRLCCLNQDTVDSWQTDFNSFVSKETGLVASFTIRDQAAELLSSFDSQDYATVLVLLVHEISQISDFSDGWIFNESLLYLLQSLLLNEANSLEFMDAVTRIFTKLQSILEKSLSCVFVNCRIILLIPKLLEKIMDSFPNVRDLVQNFLFLSLDFALSQDNELIKSATLISFTYYSYFAELPSVLGPDNCIQVQQKTLKLIAQLYPEAEDDTDGVLMEVLDNVIDCNSENVDDTSSIIQTEFHLVFTISSKDPSNIQTTIELQECLGKLLKNVDVKTFITFWEICFPPMVNVMIGSAHSSFEYSPLLSLTLQVLGVLMKRKPLDPTLSITICNDVFEPLQNILNQSKDEEILQYATEALGYLIYNTEAEVILPHLKSIVNILDALLSPGVPDQAATHVGSLTVTIFSKFSNEIQNLIPMILQAAAARLGQATNITTTQNLLSVFCFVTSADAQQTVDFLFNTTISNQNGLNLVMSKWLESFDVVRGEKRTKENIITLSKLFFLNDQRLNSMQVNGDLIPYESDIIITRSMAKEMPDRYTQVSVYHKIIKLFTSELEFQGKHQDPQLLMAGTYGIETNTEENQDDDDNDDWEDVEGPLEYERLQHYVEEDETDDRGEELDEQCLADNLDSRSVHQLLVDFFKEVAAKNISGFQSIYEQLSDNEKQILSENLL
ncbi:hypothetical protein ZYGR_0P03900 [Zygosaccharomyces rouxii]|uniref:ZYRO0E09460p n=2 Tax=Zygosaccharomyces rouxii TaxID=4956 RepID=C5E4X3_ZYGRC|nr:uncharacterized protein ZYRO0E09460g [Zygosaccharomyces rouxii]KAH9198061.1 armadillo-type protein [Zygosaccharomyces rouxii]GAV49744.1 hypothetical protein ZYGR_0P03900 [Zygosaccharomyces rouxii]CAR31084.1 ZYRO0E09460p [Zygosaccharomyces rouxii]